MFVIIIYKALLVGWSIRIFLLCFEAVQKFYANWKHFFLYIELDFCTGE